MTRTQFNEWAFQAMKTNFSAFHAEMVGHLRNAFGDVVDKIPDVAANAQRRALTDNLAPPIRMERLAELQWRTMDTPAPVILPDCVAMGVDAAGGILPLMIANLENLRSVLMPLASNRILVGSVADPAELPENVNEVFAGCSWDFFVARDRTPELESYRSLLRTTVTGFMSGAVDEAIQESVAKGLP